MPYPTVDRIIIYPADRTGMMEISETTGSTLNLVLRVLRIGCCALPVLFGLVMILWGIFINAWDLTLIILGLAVFLIFGWGIFRAITGKDT